MFWQRIHQAWLKKRLKTPQYAHLFDPPPDDDVVCFDCETTGLDPKKDSIISLSAIKIRGHEICTSESLNLTFRPEQTVQGDSIVIHRLRNMDLSEGLAPEEAAHWFLRFVGSRPLVGYYLEFDVAMVNRLIRPMLGIPLPNRQTDISELYTDLFHQPWLQPEHEVFDLSFQAIRERLELPGLGQHDAFNDALMTAMMYVKLRHLKAIKKEKGPVSLT
ncbi:3'-5' exonuclease [Thiomicrospira sp. WB1]|uniref:3'-5' exonuclease n=1 Tax=Thiomicrospira sp. WB1 TaxID=1685380 RepID=UPI00074A4380|nr:3'-5' exonuclease [Thiomicrospira sp. WB1]KUJ71972.1 DNA polymerase III subunit epsilon [Thiomicrospira sp. WB1]